MPDGPSLAIANIGQIAIPIQDLDRAVAFYRDTLGLKFLFSAPPSLAFFDCGGVRLMLSPPEGGQAPHLGSVLYFRVPDLQAAHAQLEQRGAVIVEKPHLIAPMPDHDLWMSFFRDSEGNLLALMAEIVRKR